MLLGNGVSIFFINGKPVLNNGHWKIKSLSHFRLVIFLLVPFNEIPQFSKGLIPFISFISLFVSFSPEPVSVEIPL